MRRYEPCIQIIIIRIKKKIKMKKRKKKEEKKSQNGGEGEMGEGECEKRDRESFLFFIFFLFSLLSKIYRNRTVGLRRNKKAKSIHALRAMRGHKILAFRQTPRGREFSYLCYSYLKGHLIAWDWLRGCEML